MRTVLPAGRRRASGGTSLKIASVVGARPQIIKEAMLRAAIARSDAHIDEVLVHTGQHYDYEMSQVFFDDLKIPQPDHHLAVGAEGHGRQTGTMMTRLEPVLEREQPDVVVVHGDTNSTLAGALVAAKLNIPVAHVEAGLRSGRRDMPEEINRVVTDRVSASLFCPTQTAVDNLAAEGIHDGVVLSGDVMREILEAHSEPSPEQDETLLGSFGVRPGMYALATIHRAENTDDVDRLRMITDGLTRIAREVPLVLPAHPRTQRALGGLRPDGVQVVAPVGYVEMLRLTRNARVVITDSGGLQKEAYWLGVPCVTARAETEWVETLAGGWNVLTDADPEAIATAALRPPPEVPRDEAFGGTGASDRIVEHLARTHSRESTSAR